MLGRFFQEPSTHYFLFGPRGTGKSTWLRARHPDALWIDLLAPEAQRQYAARPERLREVVAGNVDRQVVVIDEVQKVPELLDVVHELIERRLGVRFILTGSSARKLRRAGVNLLAGRALVRSLHPFLAAELGPRFRLDSALTQGLVPLVWDAERPADALRAYVALYLREEVQQEGLVRQVGDFARFLEVVSFSQAAVLNVSEVARECQVSRKTVEGYLGILEDLLLSFRVPVFTKRAQRHLSSHPKFFWFDAGVFVATRPAGPLDRPEEIAGAALEGLVAQHLRAWIDYSGEDAQLSFWRTKSGNEVDFVVYGRSGFWAIEVKHTANLRPADLRGLRAFQEDYPEAALRLLYRGQETLEMEGIRCLPVEASSAVWFREELCPDPGATIRVSTRFGSSSTRFGTLSTRLGSSSTGFGTLSTRLGSPSTRFGTLSTRLGSSSTGFGSLPGSFGSCPQAFGSRPHAWGSFRSSSGSCRTRPGTFRSLFRDPPGLPAAPGVHTLLVSLSFCFAERMEGD